VEFQRYLSARDTGWGRELSEARPPYLFRLQDQDGVTIYDGQPTYGDSVLVGLKGRRVRFALNLSGVQPLKANEPWVPREVLERTKTVLVDHPD
jgi:hypothetical protein